MNINISVAKPMWKLGSYQEALVIVISHVLGGVDPGGALAWLTGHSFRESFFDFLSFNFSKKVDPPFSESKVLSVIDFLSFI